MKAELQEEPIRIHIMQIRRNGHRNLGTPLTFLQAEYGKSPIWFV